LSGTAMALCAFLLPDSAVMQKTAIVYEIGDI
jgi:hypothetical protein